jgi:hypothetical protein
MTFILVLKRDDAPTKIHAFYPAITSKPQRIFRNHQIDLVYSINGKLKDWDAAKIRNLSSGKCTLVRQNVALNYDLVNTTAAFIYPDKSNIARHVLSRIKDNQRHSISLDNLKLVKEVRKQNDLDAYESYYISRRKKEGANLMNVAAGKITSRLFDLVLWKKSRFSLQKIFLTMAA